MSQLLNRILKCFLYPHLKNDDIFFISDDYNDEVNEGLHITSMAGTYLSIVEGFGGMRLKNEELHFNPFIPEQWKLYSFIVKYRGNHIKVEVTKEKVVVMNQNGKTAKVFIRGVEYNIKERESIEFYCN